MRSLRHALASVFALAVVLGLGVPRAHANPPDLATVRQLLSAYEAGPSLAQWTALGPETLAVLVRLYDDPDEQPFVRLRAVRAAAAFPGPAARTFLLAVAQRPGQSDLFVRSAVLALTDAFGAAALDDVRPFLTSTEPVVREAAVRALGQMRVAPARAALQARLPVEGEAHVRELISRTLNQMDGARR